MLNDSSKKLSDYGIVSSTSDKPVIMLNLAVPDQANAVATMFDEDEDEEDDPQELAKKRGEDDDDNDSFVPDRAPGGFVGLKNQVWFFMINNKMSNWDYDQMFFLKSIIIFVIFINLNYLFIYFPREQLVIWIHWFKVYLWHQNLEELFIGKKKKKKLIIHGKKINNQTKSQKDVHVNGKNY